MKYKVGDKVRVRCDLERKIYGSVSVVADMIKYRGKVVTIAYVDKDDNTYKTAEEAPSWYWWSEEMLEPVDSKTLRMADGTIIGEFSTGGVLSTDELIKKEFNVKWIEEEKKMPTKFTFYVKEGTRIDKSCNKTVPTMTTFVSIGRYHSGKATCDKADYDERQGCLEAIANAFLDGNFDGEFSKAVKKNKRTELRSRTCIYCGQVFDTIEDLKEHEDWHVECRKARHERYLLRKRAKEIAFEEAAQKLAKEIIAEDKKK